MPSAAVATPPRETVSKSADPSTGIAAAARILTTRDSFSVDVRPKQIVMPIAASSANAFQYVIG